MTKEQLQELGLSEEQISGVFKLNGLAIKAVQEKNTALEQEVADTKQLLETANTKIEGFADLDVDKIKKEAEDYKTALEKTKLENEARINELKYEAKVKDYLQNYKFASERVKNSIYNDIKSKEFKLEGDKLLGVEEYLKDLQTNEPESFATVAEGKPNFTRPGSAQINNDNGKVKTIAQLAEEISIRK